LLLEDIDISQDSAATHLRCGGIFSDSTITDFLPILTVKTFENWPIFDEVIRRTKMCHFLWGTLYVAAAPIA